MRSHVYDCYIAKLWHICWCNFKILVLSKHKACRFKSSKHPLGSSLLYHQINCITWIRWGCYTQIIFRKSQIISSLMIYFFKIFFIFGYVSSMQWTRWNARKEVEWREKKRTSHYLSNQPYKTKEGLNLFIYKARANKLTNYQLSSTIQTIFSCTINILEETRILFTLVFRLLRSTTAIDLRSITLCLALSVIALEHCARSLLLRSLLDKADKLILRVSLK